MTKTMIWLTWAWVGCVEPGHGPADPADAGPPAEPADAQPADAQPDEAQATDARPADARPDGPSVAERQPPSIQPAPCLGEGVPPGPLPPGTCGRDADGDGHLPDPGERCDDGNDQPDDGCDRCVGPEFDVHPDPGIDTYLTEVMVRDADVLFALYQPGEGTSRIPFLRRHDPIERIWASPVPLVEGTRLTRLADHRLLARWSQEGLIIRQILERDGTPAGEPEALRTLPERAHHVAAAHPDGGYLLAAGSPTRLDLVRFTAEGRPRAHFSTEAYHPNLKHLALLPDGGLVLSWSKGGGQNTWAEHVRFFDADLQPTSEALQINAFQGWAGHELAILAEGRIALAWQERQPAAWALWLQLLDPTGCLIGDRHPVAPTQGLSDFRMAGEGNTLLFAIRRVDEVLYLHTTPGGPFEDWRRLNLGNPGFPSAHALAIPAIGPTGALIAWTTQDTERRRGVQARWVPMQP